MIKIHIHRGKAKAFEDELYITWRVRFIESPKPQSSCYMTLSSRFKFRVYDRQDGPNYTILNMRTNEYEYMNAQGLE